MKKNRVSVVAIEKGKNWEKKWVISSVINHIRDEGFAYVVKIQLDGKEYKIICEENEIELAEKGE